MVERSALGATGTPFVLEVERGKLQESARATFGTPTDASPPTFLTTAFHWQSGASDPWDRVQMDSSRGLHAEQEFVFHGPPPKVGDRLVGTSRITEIYDVELTCTTQNGDVVARAWATFALKESP